MQTEKKSSRKFAPKELVIHGRSVSFKRIESDFGQSSIDFDRSGLYVQHPADDEISFQKYPSIYSVKLSGGYIRLWDVLADEYFENLGLINYRQFSLYNYIGSLRNRGYHVSLKGNGKTGDAEVKGLAQLTGVRWPTLVRDLDHLENCLLIHRIRRPDFHGTPSEIVVHSPYGSRELRENGVADVIRARIETDFTGSRRKQLQRRGVTDDGRPYVFQDRSADADRFVFDFRTVAAAFGDHVGKFTLFAMEFFTKNWLHLRRDKSAFDHDYRDRLSLEMNVWGIRENSRRERCYVAANKFRTIYCPMEEELCEVYA